MDHTPYRSHRSHRCSDEHDRHGHARHPRGSEARTRRLFLGSVAAGAVTALAGCAGFGGGDQRPEPVTLTTDDRCDVCGMVIPNHPGPSTEIFYPDNEPSGHANPARFDSTWEAFQYDFDRQDEGWEKSVTYVTDYSGVDYSVFEDQGNLLISTHPQDDAFVDAADVTFVAGSEVVGAMGRDLIGFSDEADASAFQNDYGGELVTVDDVTRELIAQLGR